MLSEGAVFLSDGGENVPAASKPLLGRQRIANLPTVVFRKRQCFCMLSSNTVNGQPRIVFSQAGKAIHVLTFAFAAEENRVSSVFSVLNPDKLLRRYWAIPYDEDETTANEP